MKCSTCDGEKIVKISAKCSDMFSMSCISEGLSDYCGYVPDDMGIGGGDYIEFSYCLDCGQMQGNFPVYISDEYLEEDEEDGSW